MSEELPEFKWKCKSCKTVAPTLERIDETLKELSIRQEQRLTNLENKMETFETNSKKNIEKELKLAKENLKEVIKQDVRQMVEERTREMDDRRRREMNVVIFNLEEGEFETGEESKVHDEENAAEIARLLDIPDLEILTSYRFGKRRADATSARPLKLILKDRKQRKKLLEKASSIKTKLIGDHKKVVIVKDLTKEQQKNRKDKIKNKKSSENQEGATGNNRDQVEDVNMSREVNNIFNEETLMMDQTIRGGFDGSQPHAGYAPRPQRE